MGTKKISQRFGVKQKYTIKKSEDNNDLWLSGEDIIASSEQRNVVDELQRRERYTTLKPNTNKPVYSTFRPDVEIYLNKLPSNMIDERREDMEAELQRRERYTTFKSNTNKPTYSTFKPDIDLNKQLNKGSISPTFMKKDDHYGSYESDISSLLTEEEIFRNDISNRQSNTLSSNMQNLNEIFQNNQLLKKAYNSSMDSGLDSLIEEDTGAALVGVTDDEEKEASLEHYNFSNTSVENEYKTTQEILKESASQRRKYVHQYDSDTSYDSDYQSELEEDLVIPNDLVNGYEENKSGNDQSKSINDSSRNNNIDSTESIKENRKSVKNNIKFFEDLNKQKSNDKIVRSNVDSKFSIQEKSMFESLRDICDKDGIYDRLSLKQQQQFKKEFLNMQRILLEVSAESFEPNYSQLENKLIKNFEEMLIKYNSQIVKTDELIDKADTISIKEDAKYNTYDSINVNTKTIDSPPSSKPSVSDIIASYEKTSSKSNSFSDKSKVDVKNITKLLERKVSIPHKVGDKIEKFESLSNEPPSKISKVQGIIQKLEEKASIPHMRVDDETRSKFQRGVKSQLSDVTTNGLAEESKIRM
ncbi:MAG: hypothetical protein KTV77_02730 [Wolbachia endosymbiont of Fragariocoptes setiger]|nr:hypothetical protein [Wolbachia endosymbiont of Fragariocoptes setiger]